MSQKKPSFQFYTGDWLRNPNLKRCTFSQRGIWIDLLCLLHHQPEPGICRWPLKELARAVGCKKSDLQGLKDLGVLKGADTGEQVEAFIYTPISGRIEGPPVTLICRQIGPLWYSSRMVRDNYIKAIKSGTYFSPKPPIGEGLGDRSGDISSSSTSSSDINTGKINSSEHGNNEFGNASIRGSQKARELKQWITD